MFDQAIADLRDSIIEIIEAATCVIVPENGVNEHGIGVAPICHRATAIGGSVAIEGDVAEGGIADAPVGDPIVDQCATVVGRAITDKKGVHKGGGADPIEAAVEDSAGPIRLIGIEDDTVEGRATRTVEPVVRDRPARGQCGVAIGNVIEKANIGKGRAAGTIDRTVENGAAIEGGVTDKGAIDNGRAAIATIGSLVEERAASIPRTVADKS